MGLVACDLASPSATAVAGENGLSAIEWSAIWTQDSVGGRAIVGVRVTVRDGVGHAEMWSVPDIGTYGRWRGWLERASAPALAKASTYVRFRVSDPLLRHAMTTLKEALDVEVGATSMTMSSNTLDYGEGVIQWALPSLPTQGAAARRGSVRYGSLDPTGGFRGTGVHKTLLDALVVRVLREAPSPPSRNGQRVREREYSIMSVLRSMRSPGRCEQVVGLTMRAACALGHRKWAVAGTTSPSRRVRGSALTCCFAAELDARGIGLLLAILHGEPEEAVRMDLVLRLLNVRRETLSLHWEDIAQALPERASRSSAVLASNVAQRGRIEGVHWFRRVILELGHETPEYVSVYAANAVELGASPRWSSHVERERVLERWRSLLADVSCLEWRPKLHQFVRADGK